MHENHIRNHRYRPQNQLLTGVQTIQVDRVLSALRCCAGGEKQGIDMTDVPWYIEKNRRYHNPGNYVYIVDCDEEEVASVFPRGHSCAGWFISGGTWPCYLVALNI